MEQALRRSAAHVLVADLADPQLDDDAAHHLRKVLRLRAGESVSATDGNGRWRSCVYDGAGLDVISEITEVTRRGAPLTVAVAAPKGDRLDWLVAKCTEVGIDGIVLLVAERSVVRWNDERAGRTVQRLRRIAIESSMQSRRVWLPEITGPVGVAEVLPSAVIAEPGGRAVNAADTTIAVGPEGGWSQKEIELASDTVGLGPNVLRVETAAVVAAVLMEQRRR